MPEAEEIRRVAIGKVLGAETYSPAKLEPHHPDLYWYGIHGVETLFTLMGTGCQRVMRVYTEETDLVIGQWEGSRIGTFRGLRHGDRGYGGRAYGEKEIVALGESHGYQALMNKIIDFFETGTPPVLPDETIEIYTFMQAANESRLNGGNWVDIEMLLQRVKNSKGKLQLN